MNYKLRIINKNAGKKLSFFPIRNSSFVIYNSAKRGMTFIELISVISIFAIISGITLFNFSSFGDSITLSNLAQDIALEIKQAQSSATAGEGFAKFQAGKKPSYGLYFSTETTPTDRTKKFIYFADKDNDGKYGSTGNEASTCEGETNTECLKSISINNGYSISSIAVNQNQASNPSCPPAILPKGKDLAIVFTRPNNDAYFTTNQSGYENKKAIPLVTGTPICDAEITIKSPKNLTRTIVVYSVGQISIQAGGYRTGGGIDGDTDVIITGPQTQP
ncbi:MAG: type II secretion system protein [Candidatus Paceibacterota bacterium]|jgi:prepilin-type N-terminal cleavage/methylation domain-containing protein